MSTHGQGVSIVHAIAEVKCLKDFYCAGVMGCLCKSLRTRADGKNTQ